mmetsp:Transcript_13523/g.31436  ORF Transcript_13523/g.31436 Transcript_13523/m.31436 type:complete len:210 (+) Transcript_13523:1076-1705(+)
MTTAIASEGGGLQFFFPHASRGSSQCVMLLYPIRIQSCPIVLSVRVSCNFCFCLLLGNVSVGTVVDEPNDRDSNSSVRCNAHAFRKRISVLRIVCSNPIHVHSIQIQSPPNVVAVPVSGNSVFLPERPCIAAVVSISTRQDPSSRWTSCPGRCNAHARCKRIAIPCIVHPKSTAVHPTGIQSHPTVPFVPVSCDCVFPARRVSVGSVDH